MACASCSRKTLSVFIDSILVTRLQSARVTPSQRLPRPDFALHRRAYHRTPARHHDTSYKHQSEHRADDNYVPFDSTATHFFTVTEHTDAGPLPGPFTRPPVPEPVPDVELAAESADEFEPNIELQDATVLQAEGMQTHEPEARAKQLDHLGRPVSRMLRKERNREKLAARRHARTLAELSGDLPEPEALAKELEELASQPQVHPQPMASDARLQAKGKTAKSTTVRRKSAASTIKPAVKLEPWRTQKDALQAKFKDEGWSPRKRLSPEALEGIRALHAQYPDHFSTPALAEQFKVSPEAIRRILKSKWRPNEEEEQLRLQRWDRRGESIWTQKVKEGAHPPKRWREMGIGAGPRRPAQDRSRAQRHGRERSKGVDEASHDHAWIGSLAAGMA